MKRIDSLKISSLYSLKAIAAFFVVACHTKFNLIESIITPLSGSAVPIFFMISAFFLYDNNVNNIENKIIKILKKTTIIYLLLQLIYYLWIFPIHGNPINNINNFIKWILLGDFITIHLWYLAAYIESLFFFLLLIKLLKEKYIKYIKLFPIILLFTLLVSKYSVFWGSKEQILHIYNFIFYGIPFISIGFLIKKYEKYISNLNEKKLLIVCILSIILTYIEAYILNSSYQYNGYVIYFFNIFMSISLMLYSISNKSLGENRLIEKIGKYHSANIYYFHIMVATIINKIAIYLNIETLYLDISTVLVYIFSIFVSFIIIRIQYIFKISIF